jgi:formamidopyrimidine-DNA glycosylase
VPELPEVQALAHDLGSRLRGRAVVRVDLLEFSCLKTFDPPLDSLSGGFIESVDRHGKFLDFTISGTHLIIHLARAGWIRWRDSMPEASPRRSRKSPVSARVVLDGGTGLEITEAGTRKSLALYVVRDPLEVEGIARLGPDPLDDSFDIEALSRILMDAGGAQLKGVLRSQSRIAGIGNAYSDEILHAAKLSPFKGAGALNADETRRLFVAIREVLQLALGRAMGLPASELKGEKKSNLAVHGRTGEPCPVCGDTIAEVSFSDSSLQYCPTCQTGGKKLSDRRMSRLLG